MIFLFTWEEKFLLDNTLNKRKKAFLQKYSRTNYFSFNEDNFDVEKIKELTLWWGIFREKKFVIIKWVPKDSFIKIPSQELQKLEKFLEKKIDLIPKDDVFVFVSYKPDKRTKFFKFLKQKAQVKEFPALTEKKLISFLQQTYKLNKDLATKILEKLWNNLYLIHNELTKILKFSPKITSFEIENYIINNTQQDTFKLLDSLNNLEEVLKIITNLEKAGEEFFKILWLLYWWLKNIILISMEKNLSWKEISTKLWIHPFVVNKFLKLKYDPKKIKKIYENIFQLEVEVKNWILPSSVAFLFLKQIFTKILN
jgi:DNA polymerase III delta subunit